MDEKKASSLKDWDVPLIHQLHMSVSVLAASAEEARAKVEKGFADHTLGLDLEEAISNELMSDGTWIISHARMEGLTIGGATDSGRAPEEHCDWTEETSTEAPAEAAKSEGE